MKDVKTKETRLQDTPIVNEFADVFLKELPRLPLKRQIKLCINLVPGMQLISIPPHRMSLIKLKEIKGSTSKFA